MTNELFWPIIYTSYTQEEIDNIHRTYRLSSESLIAKRNAFRELMRKRGYGYGR